MLRRGGGYQCCIIRLFVGIRTSYTRVVVVWICDLVLVGIRASYGSGWWSCSATWCWSAGRFLVRLRIRSGYKVLLVALHELECSLSSTLRISACMPKNETGCGLDVEML